MSFANSAPNLGTGFAARRPCWIALFQQKRTLEDPEKRRRRFYAAEVTHIWQYAANIKRAYLRCCRGVRTFGAGDCAQLGLDADTLEARRPTLTRNPRNNATLISCSSLHTVAILGNSDM